MNSDCELGYQRVYCRSVYKNEPTKLRAKRRNIKLYDEVMRQYETLQRLSFVCLYLLYAIQVKNTRDKNPDFNNNYNDDGW